MSSISNSGDPEFLDPWGKKHQGRVPEGTKIVGGWTVDLGIDSIHEVFFLERSPRQDRLWSIAVDPGVSLDEASLAAHGAKSIGPNDVLSSGCVAAGPHLEPARKSAIALLDALVQSRINYECVGPPFVSGLISGRALARTIETVVQERKRNSQAAESKQQLLRSPIVALASKLGLQPRPAGHNDNAWTANCPRRTHRLMLSASENQFGCGYCRRKGGPEEFRAFFHDVRIRDARLADETKVS